MHRNTSWALLPLYQHHLECCIISAMNSIDLGSRHFFNGCMFLVQFFLDYFQSDRKIFTLHEIIYFVFFWFDLWSFATANQSIHPPRTMKLMVLAFSRYCRHHLPVTCAATAWQTNHMNEESDYHHDVHEFLAPNSKLRFWPSGSHSTISSLLYMIVGLMSKLISNCIIPVLHNMVIYEHFTCGHIANIDCLGKKDE